jgi:hypothetical protein
MKWTKQWEKYRKQNQENSSVTSFRIDMDVRLEKYKNAKPTTSPVISIALPAHVEIIHLG